MTWLRSTEIECAPSGNPYDYLHPDVQSIELGDIALALSQTCRFGGFTQPFQSVASHCILVADILAEWGADLEVQAAGLLHDAHEAYLVDAPRPLKMSGVPEFDRLAQIADQAIADRFQIDVQMFHEPVVKDADVLALMHEGAARMPKGPAGIEVYDALPGDLQVRTESMQEARDTFELLANVFLGSAVR